MSTIPGTNVSAKIVPFDTEDHFATHDDKYGLGGYRTVIDQSERLSIPVQRQKLGMLVYEVSGARTYRLTSTRSPSSQSSDWIEVIGGAVDLSPYALKTDLIPLSASIISISGQLDTFATKTLVSEVSASLYSNINTRSLTGHHHLSSDINDISGYVENVIIQFVTGGNIYGSDIVNVPAGNITTSTVQAALNEIDTKKQNSSVLLTSVTNMSSNGIMVRSGNNILNRTLTNGSGITINNPDGVMDNPSIFVTDYISRTETANISSGINNTFLKLSGGVLTGSLSGTNIVLTQNINAFGNADISGNLRVGGTLTQYISGSSSTTKIYYETGLNATKQLDAITPGSDFGRIAYDVILSDGTNAKCSTLDTIFFSTNYNYSETNIMTVGANITAANFTIEPSGANLILKININSGTYNVKYKRTNIL